MFARATDDLMAPTTSVPVDISVNEPPAVALTNPQDNSSVNVGAPLLIEATASDDGAVSSVEFFVNDGSGSVSVGVDVEAPYALSWTPPVPSAYSLTAVAFDDLSASTVSTPVNLQVLAVTDPPIVAVLNPSFSLGKTRHELS